MRAAFYESHGSCARRAARGGDQNPGACSARGARAAAHLRRQSVRREKPGGLRKLAFPRVIPHSDGAGVIDAAGEGVARLRVGERVWIWNGQFQRPSGTAAEFIVLPAAQAARLPDNTSFEAAATLGISRLDRHGRRSNCPARIKTRRCSYRGGAGSVSQFAIQFAKARGATVITTISSPDKADVAREAGADHCIDYRREDVGARVAEITGGRGVDAVIEMDLTANAKLIPSVLRPRGSVLVYGTGAEAVILRPSSA